MKNRKNNTLAKMIFATILTLSLVISTTTVSVLATPLINTQEPDVHLSTTYYDACIYNDEGFINYLEEIEPNMNLIAPRVAPSLFIVSNHAAFFCHWGCCCTAHAYEALFWWGGFLSDVVHYLDPLLNDNFSGYFWDVINFRLYSVYDHIAAGAGNPRFIAPLWNDSIVYLNFDAKGGYMYCWITGGSSSYVSYKIPANPIINHIPHPRMMPETILSLNNSNHISVPVRENYEFLGWLSCSGVIHLPHEVDWLTLGSLPWQRGIDYNKPTTFTAVWQPINQGNQPCPNTNLARNTQGAIMTASSYAAARPAIMANNGVREGAAINSWSATGINQEWLQVDFGEVRNFNHIRIFQGGNRIMDYSFQYSNDGITWTTIRSGTRIMAATPAYYEFTHPTTIQARYVRLVSERSSGVLPIVVFEFEVFYMPTP